MKKQLNKYKPNFKSKYSTHSIIVNNLGEDNVILDVGCNEGYLELHARKNIFYGLDFDADAVKKARKHYQDVIIYDLNNLHPLPWHIRFDVLVFADVLEHVLYPERVLQFFVDKYLKKEGKVIISLPNITNWSIRLKLLIGNFDYTETGILDKTHLHLYTYKTAQKLIVNTKQLKITSTLFGASFFGPIIKTFPFLKTLLATNIILICKKENHSP